MVNGSHLPYNLSYDDHVGLQAPQPGLEARNVDIRDPYLSRCRKGGSVGLFVQASATSSIGSFPAVNELTVIGIEPDTVLGLRFADARPSGHAMAVNAVELVMRDIRLWSQAARVYDYIPVGTAETLVRDVRRGRAALAYAEDPLPLSRFSLLRHPIFVENVVADRREALRFARRVESRLGGVRMALRLPGLPVVRTVSRGSVKVIIDLTPFLAAGGGVALIGRILWLIERYYNLGARLKVERKRLLDELENVDGDHLTASVACAAELSGSAADERETLNLLMPEAGVLGDSVESVTEDLRSV